MFTTFNVFENHFCFFFFEWNSDFIKSRIRICSLHNNDPNDRTKMKKIDFNLGRDKEYKIWYFHMANLPPTTRFLLMTWRRKIFARNLFKLFFDGRIRHVEIPILFYIDQDGNLSCLPSFCRRDFSKTVISNLAFSYIFFNYTIRIPIYTLQFCFNHFVSRFSVFVTETLNISFYGLHWWSLRESNPLSKISQHTAERCFGTIFVFESNCFAITLIECTAHGLQTISTTTANGSEKKFVQRYVY